LETEALRLKACILYSPFSTFDQDVCDSFHEISYNSTLQPPPPPAFVGVSKEFVIRILRQGRLFLQLWLLGIIEHLRSADCLSIDITGMPLAEPRVLHLSLAILQFTGLHLMRSISRYLTSRMIDNMEFGETPGKTYQDQDIPGIWCSLPGSSAGLLQLGGLLLHAHQGAAGDAADLCQGQPCLCCPRQQQGRNLHTHTHQFSSYRVSTRGHYLKMYGEVSTTSPPPPSP